MPFAWVGGRAYPQYMGGVARRVRRNGFGAAAIALLLAGTTLGLASPAGAAGAAPIAQPDVASVVSGQSVTVPALANDYDPEEGPAISLVSAAVISGSGVATPSGRDVVVTATPGYVGQLVVSYVIQDTAAPPVQATGTITVDVTAPPNNPPVANPDSASVVSGGEVRLDPRANDSDPDGDALTVVAATLEPPAGGTVTIEGGSTLVIRTAAGYVGPLTVGYTLADARGAQAAGVVSVAVVAAPKNRPPTTTADSAAVKRGHSVRIPVLANDADPDGDALKLVKAGSPKKGKAKRSGASIVYTANKSFVGTVTFTYTVRDARGATSKGKVTVTVTRTPKPSAPPSKPADATRTAVEKSLARLGLPVGVANGKYDARTRRAVCAWRTISGRKAHRGLPTAAEAAAIVAMTDLPQANGTMVTGVTVSVTCQTAFWVGGDREYRRVMAACTGKPGYRTRLGTFRIFITHHTWRYSTIYPEARMYKPMQFSGGQALHGSATDRLVNTHPSSHGCVRMLHRDVDAMQAGGVGNGTTVRVIGHW